MVALKQKLHSLIIIFLLLFSNVVYTQTSKIEVLKSQYKQTEKITFKILNNFSEKLYYYVKLEKYNFYNNEYSEYSRDVFADNDHPAELTLQIEKDSSLILSFSIKESVFLYLRKSKKENDNILRQKENEKKGVFRLKILLGVNERNKNTFIYSEDFIIK